MNTKHENDFGNEIRDRKEVEDMIEERMKREKANKLFMYTSLSFIAAASMALLYVIWLILAPVKVLEIRDVTVEPKPVEAGEVITVYVDYCKYKDLEAQVTIVFNEEPALPAFQVPVRLPVGCHDDHPIRVIIPASTPDGMRSLTFKHTYRTSALHSETVSYRTPKFKVDPSKYLQLFNQQLDEQKR